MTTISKTFVYHCLNSETGDTWDIEETFVGESVADVEQQAWDFQFSPAYGNNTGADSIDWYEDKI